MRKTKVTWDFILEFTNILDSTLLYIISIIFIIVLNISLVA